MASEAGSKIRLDTFLNDLKLEIMNQDGPTMPSITRLSPLCVLLLLLTLNIQTAVSVCARDSSVLFPQEVKDFLSDPRYRKATWTDHIPIYLGKIRQNTNLSPQQVEAIMSDPRYDNLLWQSAPVNNEPIYRGQPLSKFLQNTNSSGNRELTLDEMFTLKEVITGDEPRIISYQLPIQYSALGDHPPYSGLALDLLIDCNPTGGSWHQPLIHECRRATNSDCILSFNAAYVPRGEHALQAVLYVEVEGTLRPLNPVIEVRGPVKPFSQTLLIRSYAAAALGGKDDAFFTADLYETNAMFTIDVISKTGADVTTLNGRTTNGEVRVDWDMIDRHGHKYTNDSFDSVLHVSSLDSGRSESLKQK